MTTKETTCDCHKKFALDIREIKDEQVEQGKNIAAIRAVLGNGLSAAVKSAQVRADKAHDAAIKACAAIKATSTQTPPAGRSPATYAGFGVGSMGVIYGLLRIIENLTGAG